MVLFLQRKNYKIDLKNDFILNSSSTFNELIRNESSSVIVDSLVYMLNEESIFQECFSIKNLDLLTKFADFTISSFSFLDLFFKFFSEWRNNPESGIKWNSRVLSATCKLFRCLQSHLLDVNWIWFSSSHEKFMITLNISLNDCNWAFLWTNHG